MGNDLKLFLSAISNDDYIEADKHFPNVVKNAVKKIINKRKPDIVDNINKDANKISIESVREE